MKTFYFQFIIKNQRKSRRHKSNGKGVKNLWLKKWTKKEQDGYAFKDFLGTGELVPYEDWRLSYEERARDLAGKISVEDIAGLMLYSGHQLIPAKGPGAATFGGTGEGHTYDFGFGMNFDGVIADERVSRYHR